MQFSFYFAENRWDGSEWQWWLTEARQTFLKYERVNYPTIG